MTNDRSANSLMFLFEAGETESQRIFPMDRGCFGTIICEPGSDAVGKSLQFVAIADHQDQNPYPDTELLEAPKLLVAGANAITSDEITQVGAAKQTRLRLDSAVASETKIWVLWKS